MITRYRGSRLSSNQIKQLTDDKLIELLPDKSTALAGRVSLTLIQTIDQAVDLLERDVQKKCGEVLWLSVIDYDTRHRRGARADDLVGNRHH
jgi:hypothetical protein